MSWTVEENTSSFGFTVYGKNGVINNTDWVDTMVQHSRFTVETGEDWRSNHC